jgi:pimeloyl-ACP methyl ester carboxylesterase
MNNGPNGRSLTCFSGEMLKKIGIVLLVLIALIIGGQAVLYAFDGHPLPETEQFLSGANFAVTRGDDGSFVYRSAAPNGRGLVIMHGALIKPQSYANTAAFFAGHGYTVYMPYGGLLRLPINAVDAAAARRAEFGIDDWYFIGHSMGGLAALELWRLESGNVRGIALWGSGMPFDYTDVTAPLLFLWGDDDGILTAERMDGMKQNLPSATRYVTVAGGNHRNFAMYSHQFFDNEGTLDWDEQVGLANERTRAFFEEISRPARTPR